MSKASNRSWIVSVAAIITTLFASLGIAAAATDVTPPHVDPVSSDVFAASPHPGDSMTFYVHATDDVGVISCELFVDGADVGAMALQPSGVYGKAYRFSLSTTLGAHSANARCADAAGHSGMPSGDTIFQVIGPTADISAPNVGTVFANIETPSQGTAVTYYVNANDDVAVTACELFIDNTDAGAMTLQTSGSYAKLYQFTSSTTLGTHAATARCADAVGHSGISSGTKYFQVVASVGGRAPDLDPVSLDTAAPSPHPGSSVSFYVHVTGSTNIMSCELFIDNADAGAMTLQPSGSYANGHQFPVTTSVGTHYAAARCTDAAGLTGITSGVTYFQVVSPDVTTVPSSNGSLVKLRCGSYTSPTDPCRAVYYVDGHGVRHPFTSGRVYSTWYKNFDQVVEVDAATLQAMRLGQPVPYRPGTIMIKFTSDPRVYEVDRVGALHWVTDERTAVRLRGSLWNKDIVEEDITNFGLYHIGTDLSAGSTYHPIDETGLTPTIEYILPAR